MRMRVSRKTSDAIDESQLQIIVDNTKVFSHLTAVQPLSKQQLS